MDHYLQAHASEANKIEKTASAKARGILIIRSREDRLEDVLEKAPSLLPKPGSRRNSPAVIDWAGRDENNRTLGRAGEEYIAGLERRQLIEIGRADLASRVAVVSASRGDGLGYDILSFSEDGKERYLEVKTTLGGIERPFYISRAELEFSRSQQYLLYRVFKKNERVGVYIIRPPMEKRLQLEPVNFKAWPVKTRSSSCDRSKSDFDMQM